MKKLGFVLCCIIALQSCQKMERPGFAPLIPDPTPPPYSALKSFWAFEDNLTDAGENKFGGTGTAVSYVTGITGKALKIGAGGYYLPSISDTLVASNDFVSVPGDTLKKLGSFTLSFWINSVGPVQGGAQGIFAISNSSEFWGNCELFFENWNNGDEAFLKIHLFNAGVASGNGEEWNEVKIPNAFNKWTHYAITYNAANSKLNVYADGALTALNNKVLGGGNYGNIKFNNVSGMVLGSFAFQTSPSLTNHGPEGWAKSLDGSIDQFRIYNKALTDTEINGLFVGKL